MELLRPLCDSCNAGQYRTRSPVRAASLGAGCSGGGRVFDDWLPFAIYGLFAVMIPATMMIGSFVFATRPHRRVSARTIPFESGVSQGPPRRQRFTVSFYLTAMLFILFDIEIVFLYPLAVILHELAWFGFFELLVFLLTLLVAYVYIWRKGALNWR